MSKNQSKINTNSLIKLQNKIKYKLKFLKNINNELQFIYNIIKNITMRIRNSLVVNIISQTKFNQYMNEVENTFLKFNNIYKNNINCQYLTSVTHYNLLLNISKIKLDLIKIMKNCGSNSIEDISSGLYMPTLIIIALKELPCAAIKTFFLFKICG